VFKLGEIRVHRVKKPEVRNFRRREVDDVAASLLAWYRQRRTLCRQQLDLTACQHHQVIAGNKIE
jgi:hypothetical protein